MSEFPSLALQAFLGSAAILFGIFGLLYSIYATASLQVTATNPARPPVVTTLRWLCKAIASLGLLNAAFTIYSLYLVGPTGNENIALAVGLVLVVVIPAGLSAYLAFSLD